MKLIVFILAVVYLISPVDLMPGLIDDIIVMLISGGYLMTSKANEEWEDN